MKLGARKMRLPSGPADESGHRGARRQSARYPVDGHVRITRPVRAEGFLFNMSAGGLRLALNRGVATGDVVEFELRVADAPATTERARVVWSREQPDGWLVGMCFLG